jgi:sigma-B regulation protein RsbU (phosphoserine phosphatase)
MEAQVLTVVRDQVGAIALGTVFMFVGVMACAIAAIRGRGAVRILVWFGLLSLMWGMRIMASVPAAFSVLPRSLWASRPAVIAILSYVTVLPALLFFLELSRGSLRRLLQMMFVADLVVCLAGIYSVLFTGSPYRCIPFSNVLVIALVLIVATVIWIPSLSERFGFPRHWVSQLGLAGTGLAALYTNLGGFLHLPEHRFLEPVAFAVFVFTLGYVLIERIVSDGRRLLSIESELAIARDLQSSTLPSGVPDITSLRISAAYLPATAVAGDFYEFIPVDRRRIGFLVADVSGHGVAAALIAAMIKVAMQSLVSCAQEPGEVLRGLNRILAGQLRGQLISAAYLWLDTEQGHASYSAAGHPPLLCWRQGRLDRIESNGLLIGVILEPEYPVCEFSLNLGDRFLLYTDGVVEPENAAGESFGDSRLEEVIRRNQSQPPLELSNQMMAEIRRWQPAPMTQQDDITLIVVDVAQLRPSPQAVGVETIVDETQVSA